MKFKTLEMAKQEVLWVIRNTTGPGCPGKARQRVRWSRPCYHIHVGLLAIRRPSPSGAGERATQGWEEGGQRRSGQSGVRNEHRGSGHGGPGRNDWGQDRGHD